MENRLIKIVDSTLRDGNHTVKNSFNLEDIKEIVKSLDESKIDVLEVGYGYGLGSFKEENHPSDREIIETAIENTKFSQIGILVFPDKVSIEEFEEILDLDIGLIRIAVQSSNVEPAKKYIEMAKNHNKVVGGFMMMASRVSKEKFVEESLKLKEYGAENITITDSAGAMVPKDVSNLVRKVKEATSLEIGFHTHDNLGLAVGNSVLAIDSGASFVDTALAGLGAGAGNTKTEILVAVLEKSDYKVNANLNSLLDGVKNLEQICNKYDYNVKDTESELLIGYTGIYSTFMKEINRLSKEYSISSRELLREISGLGIVPGQEKIIEDKAIELSKK